MFYPINTFHVTRDWYWKKGFLQTLETYSAKHTNKSLWVPNKCLVLSQYPKPDKKKRSQRDVKKTTNQWYLSAVSPISPIMYLGFLWYYIYTERRKRTSIILLKDSSDKMLVCLFVCLDKFTLIKRTQSFDFYFFRTPIRFYTENWGTIEPKQLTCTAELSSIQWY